MVLSYKCCFVELLVVVIEVYELVFCLCKEYMCSQIPQAVALTVKTFDPYTRDEMASVIIGPYQ